MIIEKKIESKYLQTVLFTALSVASIGVGFYGTLHLGHDSWVTGGGAIAAAFAVMAQQCHTAGMSLINPGAAFAAEGENERRRKYLPRFIRFFPKHTLIPLGILSGLVCAFGKPICDALS